MRACARPGLFSAFIILVFFYAFGLLALFFSELPLRLVF